MLPRIKVRSVKHRFQCAITSKNAKWKLCPRKFVLLIAVPSIFFMFLWPLTGCHHNNTSHSVSRWIWSSSDHRYASNLNINWEEISGVLDHLPQDSKHQEFGLLNFDQNEIHQWEQLIANANLTVLSLHHAEPNVTWESLYPEWIDEEQDNEAPQCPSLTNLEAPRRRLNLIAVKLPCRDKNWNRDVASLHLQIAAARLAASYRSDYPVHLLFLTAFFPMPNLFQCIDLVARIGNAWLYKPTRTSLRQKVRLPVGSCELELPVEDNIELDCSRKNQREAYATILHSADAYVCGAIVAGQGIQMSGSTKDLVILVDESIGYRHRYGLEQAGWKVRTMQRIRNPKAEKDAYNEWNYSKFRLWQLTDYDKIIFIDADMLILRNIDFLFALPEISATGNNKALFNSGVMLIEPSNCTFQLLMDHIDEIKSSNGGDQGYLNEIFTWWHRLPRRVNYLKHFWVGDDEATKKKKMAAFEAEPAVVDVIHYLGNKPWMCYKDYDCNWNVEVQREFASDAAHERWWKVHDRMGEGLREMCLLRAVQKAQLEVDRREAERRNFSDGHWRVEIRDPRRGRCAGADRDCNWQGMLRHWVKKTASPA